MKKKRGRKIWINFSNHWLYIFMILGILAIIGAGVYAYANPTTGVGHDYTDIQPCSDGQILKTDDGVWTCDESQWKTSGSNIYYSEGNVGIGATPYYGYKLSVYNGFTRFYHPGTTSPIVNIANGGNWVYLGGDFSALGAVDVSSTNGPGIIARGGYSGTFSFTGQPGIVGVGKDYDFLAAGPGKNYASTSSIRWKDNITEIQNALGKVMNIRGVYFNWDKEHGGEHDIGFIAEEVGEYIPEIVSYEDDGIYANGLDYGAITPLLVEAIKEQQKEIESLKNEIESLKDKC